jgi:hypothetical protein
MTMKLAVTVMKRLEASRRHKTVFVFLAVNVYLSAKGAVHYYTVVM